MTTPLSPGASREEAERSSHWATLQEAGMSTGLWFLYFWHKLFGRRVYRALLVPVCWYFALTRPVARRASMQFLRRVGAVAPEAGTFARWSATVRHIRSFADALLDKALVWTNHLDIRAARVEVDPRFDAAVDRGEGGVLVVAHFGNLEVLRAIGERLRKIQLHILVHTRHAQRFNNVLKRLNPESGEHLLQVTELDAATAAYLADAVSRGHFVVIAADRVPVASGHVLDVPFLGEPAPLPIGPWVLAGVLKCPAYWLACFKEPDDRYTLVCERIVERMELPRARRNEALREVMGQYVRELERNCRRAPLAWFNFYPFWAPLPGRASAPGQRTAAPTETTQR
jgi:predicted LPLAT superfamily acyltransferase